MSEVDEKQAEPVPGSDEYNQAMVDKFQSDDASETEDLPLVAEMPEGGKEKFFNAETGVYNWEAHAKEAEFNFSGRPKTKAEDEEIKKLQIEQPETTEEDEAAMSVIDQAGLSSDDLLMKIRDTGDLTEEDYTALKKVGLPEGIVKDYVENVKFRLDTERASAFDYAGGEETFQQMSEWAVSNMNDAEIAGINKLLDSADWRLGVDALKARMGPQPVQSKEPTRLNGDVVTGSQSGYRSKSEMKKDMATAEYRSDPAFRQRVMQKMQTATWDLDAQ